MSVTITHWLSNFDPEGDPLRLHSVLRGASAEFPKLNLVLAFARMRAGYPADAEDAILSNDQVMTACEFWGLATIDDVRGLSFDVDAIRPDVIGQLCQPRPWLSFETQALPTMPFDGIHSIIMRDLDDANWCRFVPSDNNFAAITKAHIDEILRKAPPYPGPYYADGRDCDNSVAAFLGWLSQCRPDAGNLPIGTATVRLYNSETGPVTTHRLAVAVADYKAILIDCFTLSIVAKNAVMGYENCMLTEVWM